MTSTLPAPGVYVSSLSSGPNNPGPATGTWFVTGECAMGPVGVPIPITSLAQFVSYCGTRQSYSYLYDALQEFFQDGGQQAYVSRVLHSTAVAASVVLDDATSATTLKVSASSPGAWGNSLSVVVTTVSSDYTIQILLNGVVVATSPLLTSPADAVTWATTSTPWAFPVSIAIDGSGANPAAGTFSLTSGVDNLASVAESDWTAALVAFTTGAAAGVPGQVSAPGHSTATGWNALISHAQANNRFALLDDTDTATAATIEGYVTTIQETAAPFDPSYGMMLAPWVIIPGLPQGVGAEVVAQNRTIPPSAVAAALMARNDVTNSCDVAAAGPNGVSNYAVGVTNVYVPSDLQNLNNGGVSVFKVLNGQVTLYGYRTCTTDPNWVQAGPARFRMQLTYLLSTAAEAYVFAPIDPQGKTLAAFQGALTGVLQPFYASGSLYGESINDAFNVNVSNVVNTPAGLAQGVLAAVISYSTSPTAEVVTITIVKYPITQQIPQS